MTPENERQEKLNWLVDAASNIVVMQMPPRDDSYIEHLPELTNWDRSGDPPPQLELHMSASNGVDLTFHLGLHEKEHGPIVLSYPVGGILSQELQEKIKAGPTDRVILFNYLTNQRRFMATFLLTIENWKLLEDVLKKDPSFFYYGLKALNRGPLMMYNKPIWLASVNNNPICSDSLKIYPSVNPGEGTRAYLQRATKEIQADAEYNQVRFRFPESFDPNTLGVFTTWKPE